MRAYRQVGFEYDTKDVYLPNRGLAHDDAKARLKGGCWNLVEGRIELVEFDVDQRAVCEMLSGWGVNMKVLQTWALTPRGGLREVPNGE